MKGTLNWFDKHSGKGSIISENNIYYRIHEFTKIDGELDPKAKLEFELSSSSIRPIVNSVKVIK